MNVRKSCLGIWALLSSYKDRVTDLSWRIAAYREWGILLSRVIVLGEENVLTIISLLISISICRVVGRVTYIGAFWMRDRRKEGEVVWREGVRKLLSSFTEKKINSFTFELQKQERRWLGCSKLKQEGIKRGGGKREIHAITIAGSPQHRLGCSTCSALRVFPFSCDCLYYFWVVFFLFLLFTSLLSVFFLRRCFFASFDYG